MKLYLLEPCSGNSRLRSDALAPWTRRNTAPCGCFEDYVTSAWLYLGRLGLKGDIGITASENFIEIDFSAIDWNIGSRCLLNRKAAIPNVRFSWISDFIFNAWRQQRVL